MNSADVMEQVNDYYNYIFNKNGNWAMASLQRNIANKTSRDQWSYIEAPGACLAKPTMTVVVVAC